MMTPGAAAWVAAPTNLEVTMANEQATVTWSVEQGVGRITMNRPDAANAFNRQSARDLAVAIDHVLASPALRVVVLTGNGPMFCGGGDIAEFIEHPDDLPELVDDILSPLLKSFERLATATVPIVKAVRRGVVETLMVFPCVDGRIIDSRLLFVQCIQSIHSMSGGHKWSCVSSAICWRSSKPAASAAPPRRST